MDGRRRRGGRERLRLNLGLAEDDTTDDPTSPYFADGEVLTRAQTAVCAVPDRQAALQVVPIAARRTPRQKRTRVSCQFLWPLADRSRWIVSGCFLLAHIDAAR